MNPVQFYQCLADDTRLRCVLLIQLQQELCVCELTEALDLSQPKVSRHLALLRQCGLLDSKRVGQWVFYRINPALPDWAKQVIAQSSQANSSFIQINIDKLRAMNARPDRASLCCE